MHLVPLASSNSSWLVIYKTVAAVVPALHAEARRRELCLFV